MLTSTIDFDTAVALLALESKDEKLNLVPVHYHLEYTDLWVETHLVLVMVVTVSILADGVEIALGKEAREVVPFVAERMVSTGFEDWTPADGVFLVPVRVVTMSGTEAVVILVYTRTVETILFVVALVEVGAAVVVPFVVVSTHRAMGAMWMAQLLALQMPQ